MAHMPSGSELEDLHAWWWSLSEEERTAHREAFSERLDSDYSFRRTVRILLELQDENAELRETLRLAKEQTFCQICGVALKGKEQE